jgi:hypothetical protein
MRSMPELGFLFIGLELEGEVFGIIDHSQGIPQSSF